MAELHGFPPDLLESLAPRTFMVERTDHGIDLVEQYEEIEQPDVTKPVFYKSTGTRRLRLTPDEARSIWEQLGREVNLG